MPDYLGFLCLRNEQHAVTTISSLCGTEVPEAIRCVLCEERFVNLNASAVPTRRAILFGDPLRPYLRYGAMDFGKTDRDAVAAMQFVSVLWSGIAKPSR